MPDVSREEAIERLLDRIAATAADPAPGFPHYGDPDDGRWTRSPAGDWTGGFWVGMLWLAAAALDEGYRPHAMAWAERVRPRATSDTIFRGFLFWYGAALGDLIGSSPDAGDIAMEGAAGLAGSFIPVARVIPLGTEAEEATSVGLTEANIDGVPGGTPLLLYAARKTNDERLEEMAVAHAERHIELCVRPDGSVCQSASFDAHTGEMLRRYTHKGIRDDSTWLRAQAWAMLGFSQAAQRWPDSFTGVALAVSDWFLDHLPDDGVCFWDFDDPDIPDTDRDTSGTAIAAAALLKLAPLAGAREGAYRDAAARMVDALVGGYLTPHGAGGQPPGILTHGCYNRRIGLATRNELIWGSYFLFEALLNLTGRLDTTEL